MDSRTEIRRILAFWLLWSWNFNRRCFQKRQNSRGVKISEVRRTERTQHFEVGGERRTESERVREKERERAKPQLKFIAFLFLFLSHAYFREHTPTHTHCTHTHIRTHTRINQCHFLTNSSLFLFQSQQLYHIKFPHSVRHKHTLSLLLSL